VKRKTESVVGPGRHGAAPQQSLLFLIVLHHPVRLSALWHIPVYLSSHDLDRPALRKSRVPARCIFLVICHLSIHLLRASPRVCQNILGKSCVLPTAKKLYKVKKEFISNSLA
jgi:hypothetical protein